MNDELHTFNVNIITVTDAALLVQYEDREIWLPASQIEYNEVDLAQAEKNCNVDIEIEVPEWLAYEKEMI